MRPRQRRRGARWLWLVDAAEQRFEPVSLPNAPADEPWWRRFHAALIRDFVVEIGGDGAPSATFADGAMREGRWAYV